MRVFDWSCYTYVRPYNHHKLAFRSERCIFLGHNSLYKGYQRLYSLGKVYINKYVIFYETFASF